MKISTEIGNIIKNTRELKKISQKELSILAFGNPERQEIISKAESGKKPLISFETIYIILKALDIDIIRILGEVSHETNNKN